ncbi:hypothetical protein FIU87_12600 [Bacillus sp. THAF10]|nr:hypothetical protein FIU87_12600 [Bacillus sp. THAF10]
MMSMRFFILHCYYTLVKKIIKLLTQLNIFTKIFTKSCKRLLLENSFFSLRHYQISNLVKFLLIYESVYNEVL